MPPIRPNPATLRFETPENTGVSEPEPRAGKPVRGCHPPLSGEIKELVVGTADSAHARLLARSITATLGFQHDQIQLVELFPWGITVHTKDGHRTHFAGKIYG